MPERGSIVAQWATLSSKFPATLVKDKDPTALEDGETPDAYGLGLDRPFALYYETSPSSGTAWTGISTVTEPTSYPVASATWRYAHNRLWGFVTTSNTIYYGALGYNSIYVLDGLGYVFCDFESSNTIQLIPFGNNIAVFKSDHLYIIRNADNLGAGFVAEYVKQASGLPAAADVLAIDNTLVWANTYGLWAFDGQQITELTLPIRNNLGSFVSTTLTSLKADFQKRRIIGRIGSDATTNIIIGLGEGGGLYDYSTTGFRFTTPTVVAKEGEPLLIDKIGIHYQYNASARAVISIDVKINDTWKTENQFKIYPARDNGYAELPLTNILTCRRFALRITDISPSFYISKITAHIKTGGLTGYSSK